MTSHQNYSSARFRSATVLLLILLIRFGGALSAQTIEIKLVDGRNGTPMVGKASYVNVWIGTERKEAIAIPTNRDGIVRLQLTPDSGDTNIPEPSKDRGSIVVDHPIVKYDDSFQINVPYALCVPEGPNYSWLRSEHFSTKQILQHGYVSPNACGKTKALQKPGEVILFVRPLTWRERLKQ